MLGRFMSKTDLYDSLATSYDLMISWERRLKREKPFFTRIFKKFGVRRILDTACGTGKHAIAFRDWGYYVIGMDISRGMLQTARRNTRKQKIEFVEAGFTETDKVGGLFDAVTCLGNSLPHVLTDEDLDKSLASMYDILLPGGILIIHNNNYDRILGRKECFMPLAQGKQGGREHLFLRFFDFHDDLLTFNVVSMTKKSGKWEMHPDSSTHRALMCDLLTDRLEKAGFTDLQIFGSFTGEPFVEMDSDNLIIVAQKPHTQLSMSPGEPIAALNRIPIHENGEPMVNITEIEVRDSPAFARKTVVKMLKRAQAALPEGFRLKLRTAYRPFERQREMYEGFCGQLAEKHPDWPMSRIRREVNKFLAPPDAKHPPGHTTGGAVDVTIVGPDGEELDMISAIRPADSFMVVLPTYGKEVTPRAAKNRRMLVDAMLGAGFSNYPGEWWHYSYGDNAWALRTGTPHALYGAAEPPNQ